MKKQRIEHLKKGVTKHKHKETQKQRKSEAKIGRVNKTETA